MESRSFDGSSSERVKVSEEKVEEKPKVVKKQSSETVQLVLQRNLKLKYKGPVSGKEYFFSGAGAIVDVDEEDADIMLQKRGGTCCEGSGSTAPQPYFVKL
jgi:hypothetical protein